MAELERERETKQRELDELDRRINTRTAYGDDPFRNGDILKVMMTYPSGGGSYTYVALKAAGRFYLTGKIQRTILNQEMSETDARRMGWTWEQLVAWLAAGDASVWRVSKLEKVL
jgi:hypothetical protein